MMIWKALDSPLPVGTGRVLGPILPCNPPMPNPPSSALLKPGTPPFCLGVLVNNLKY
jgi:hypothetical protein